MARGLKVNFKDDGAVISLDEEIENLEASTQNALVNVATTKGSDSFTSKKGSSFLSDLRSAGVVNLTEAQHYCNFAAGETLKFVNSSSLEEDLLDEFNLKASHFTDTDKLVINVTSTDNNGNTYGVETLI